MATETLPSVLDEAVLSAVPARHEDDAARAAAEPYRGLPPLRPYLDRFGQLKAVRQPMEAFYREVQRYLLPDCGRFLNGDDTAGDEEFSVDMDDIHDSSPRRALDTAASGLHGGLTSPSVPWFDMFVGNYLEFGKGASEAVKNWVYNAASCVRDILARSNFYAAQQRDFVQQLGFLTSCTLITRDPETVARFQSLECGSYWLGQGDDFRINTMYRKYSSTARDIAARYGLKQTPRAVMDALRGKRGDQRFYIIQAIQPWNWFGNGKAHPRFRYEDVRFVEGSAEDDPILYRGGYVSKPFVATRWADAGDYVYCRSGPGMFTLPDNRQLQLTTILANKGLEWKVDPAWAVPDSLKEKVDTVNPGDIITYPGMDGKNIGVVPLFPAGQFDLASAQAKIEDLRQMLRDGYLNPYFSMLQFRQQRMTATEIMQLVQEKSDLLGPVVMQNTSEGLAPKLSRTFDLAVDEGLLPPAPEEIQGKELLPYFTSSLALAQRQAANSGMSTFAAYVLQMVQLGLQEVVDVVDGDAWLRELAESGQIPESIIRGEDEVERIRSTRQQAAQQQQQAAGVIQAADTARTLSQAEVAPNNGLGMLMEAEGGQ